MLNTGEEPLLKYRRALAKMKSKRKKAWQRASFPSDMEGSLPGAAPSEEDVALNDIGQGRAPDQWLHNGSHKPQMASSMPTFVSMPSFSKSSSTWGDWYVLDGEEPLSASVTSPIAPAASMQHVGLPAPSSMQHVGLPAPSGTALCISSGLKSSAVTLPGQNMSAPNPLPATLSEPNKPLPDSPTAQVPVGCLSGLTDGPQEGSSSTVPIDLMAYPAIPLNSFTSVSAGRTASKAADYAGLRAGFLVGRTLSQTNPPPGAVLSGIPAVDTADLPASAANGTPARLPAGQPTGLHAGFLLRRKPRRAGPLVGTSLAGITATVSEITAASISHCDPEQPSSSRHAAHKAIKSAAADELLLDLEDPADAMLASEELLDSAMLDELVTAGALALTQEATDQPAATEEETFCDHMSDCQPSPRKTPATVSTEHQLLDLTSEPKATSCEPAIVSPARSGVSLPSPATTLAPISAEPSAPTFANLTEGLPAPQPAIPSAPPLPLATLPTQRRASASTVSSPAPFSTSTPASATTGAPICSSAGMHSTRPLGLPRMLAFGAQQALTSGIGAAAVPARAPFSHHVYVRAQLQAATSAGSPADGPAEPMNSSTSSPADEAMGGAADSVMCKEQAPVGAQGKMSEADALVKAYEEQLAFESLCTMISNTVAKFHEPLRRGGIIAPSCQYKDMLPGTNWWYADSSRRWQPSKADIENLINYNTALLTTVLQAEGPPLLPPGVDGPRLGHGACGAVFDLNDHVIKAIGIALEDLQSGGVSASSGEAVLAYVAELGWVKYPKRSLINEATGLRIAFSHNVTKVLADHLTSLRAVLEDLRENQTTPNTKDSGVILFIKYPKRDGDLRIHLGKYLHTDQDNGHCVNVPQLVCLATQLVAGMRRMHKGYNSLYNDWKLDNLLVQSHTPTPHLAGVGDVRLYVGDLGAITAAKPDGPLVADDALVWTPCMAGEARFDKRVMGDFSVTEADEVDSVGRVVTQMCLGCSGQQVDQVCGNPNALALTAFSDQKELDAFLAAHPKLRDAVQAVEPGPAWDVLQYALQKALQQGPAGQLYADILRHAALMSLASYWADPNAPAGQLSKQLLPRLFRLLPTAKQLKPAQFLIGLGCLEDKLTEASLQIAAAQGSASVTAASDGDDDESSETHSSASQALQHEGGQVWSVEEHVAASEHAGHALSSEASDTSSEDGNRVLEHQAGQPSSHQQAGQAESTRDVLASSHGRGSSPASTLTGSSSTLPNVLGRDRGNSSSTQPNVLRCSSRNKVVGGSSSSSTPSKLVGGMLDGKLRALVLSKCPSAPALHHQLQGDNLPLVQSFRSQASPAPDSGRAVSIIEMLKEEHAAQAASVSQGALSTAGRTTLGQNAAFSSVAADTDAVHTATEYDTIVSPALTSHGQPPVLDDTTNSPAVASHGQPPVLDDTTVSPAVPSHGQAPILDGTANSAAQGSDPGAGMSSADRPVRRRAFKRRPRRLAGNTQQAPSVSPLVQEAEQHSVPPQRKWQRACMWGALGAVAATAVVVVAGVCRARR